LDCQKYPILEVLTAGSVSMNYRYAICFVLGFRPFFYYLSDTWSADNGSGGNFSS